LAQLIFTQNKFILLGLDAGVEPPSKSWLKNFANNSYITKDINAAAQFRNYADEKTERIFKKFLSKVYPLPSAIKGGVICPSDLQLFDYQRNKGLPHILSGNRKYLAHDPGLGKTAQAVCSVNLKPGRTLIICPSFLKLTWAREITKWSVDYFPQIQIVPESAKSFLMNWHSDFIIVSDSMLTKPWVFKNLFKIEFKFIFIDEAHRFKSPSAARTAALFGGQVKSKVEAFVSPGLIFKAEHVCALSGTPIVGSAIDLWPIIYGLNPGIINFMTYNEFGFSFCEPRSNYRGGGYTYKYSRNTENLKKLIMPELNPFMQRIKKDEVLKDLPDKIVTRIYVNNPDAQGDEWENEIEDFKDKYGGGAELPEGLGDFARIRHNIGLLKVPFAISYISNLLIDNEKEQLLVFAHHRDVVELLSNHFVAVSHAVINGGVNNERRTEIEDAFQNGAMRIIFGNIDAMNLGLTLTKATRVIFVEYSWSPSANGQAEDRAHRIGQKDCVNVEYLVLEKSLDEIILDVVNKKQQTIKSIIEGD
jgi:SWI/SNF-related matrix-associated actin-dependent regulator 1 of chromatin subfamily A